MKRTVLVILLLTAGLGIIAFPFIGNYLNQKNSTQVIENYQRKKLSFHLSKWKSCFNKRKSIMRICSVSLHTIRLFQVQES